MSEIERNFAHAEDHQTAEDTENDGEGEWLLSKCNIVLTGNTTNSQPSLQTERNPDMPC